MSVAPPPAAPRDQLTGWKEIGTYLGKSVRTVQRWEQRYGLPVHRVPGSADVVLASKDEIERWKRSEASSEIPDLNQADDLQPTALPPQLAVRARIRLITILVIVMLVAIVVTVHLARRRPPVEQASIEDDAALFQEPPYTLQWKPMEELATPERRADGSVIDPAFVNVEPRAVIFDYEKRDGAGRARPYVFARLAPPPESPRLRFSYIPHADARVSHWAGFADNSGFVRMGEETIGYWVPKAGVALRLDRTNKAYANSRASVWTFAGGEPRVIAAERPLRFQLEPGHRYDCTVEIEGWHVSATVSDGGRVDAFVGTLDAATRADRLFIADAHDGISSLSPRGRYRLRFENIDVRDALYNANIGLVTAPADSRGAAPSSSISLIIHSNRSVDATALDQASIRLSEMPVLRGGSDQGFACRRADMNGDGVFDLVCDFDRRALKLGSGARGLVLRARTTYGRRVAGRLSLPGLD